MKEKLISIQNSGESLEKSISLLYTAIQTDFDFYDNYNVEIYYGHNLPKKNLDISAHGTVKFYSKYASELDWCPPCKKQELFLNKLAILDTLVHLRIISERVAEKMANNIDKFWAIVSQLPIDYIYPEFILKLEKGASKIFNGVAFKRLHLEENFMELYGALPEEKQCYSIYALELDGTIGRYYLDITKDQYSERNLYHMFKELNRKPILSGNSAILLAQIQLATRKSNGIIGYREHRRYPRPNREYALNLMLNGGSVIEPKNTRFSRYFDVIDSSLDVEQQANLAIAKVYLNFIEDNVYTLNL